MNKILLYTAHDTNYSYIGDLTAANKLQYCEAHGYDFFCKRKDFIDLPISWDKISTIIKIFEKYNYEYIFWTDADAFIHNKNFKVEDILKFESLKECDLIHSEGNLNCSSVPADKKTIKQLKPNKDPFFWVSTCSIHGPCLGSFLIKKCQDSINFLEFILSKKDFYYDCCNWWDQRAFHHYLLNDEIDSSRINILSHNKINAYWNDVNPEDFIVHLAATKAKDRIKKFILLNPYKC